MGAIDEQAADRGKDGITPEMVKAGADVLETDAGYFTEEVLASRIYIAMQLARNRSPSR